MTGSLTQDLTARSISAFLWGGAGSLLKLLIQVCAQIVLARLLGPEEYGLFAIGVIAISLSNFLSDIGLAYGLIQRKDVSESHIRYVFSWQLVLGAAVTVAIELLSGVLAGLFNEPRAANVIAALGPLCFVQALTAISLNLLKRGLDFKTINLAGAVSYFLGFVCVGIPLAMAGYRVSALVVAWTVQATANLAILYARTRHPLRPMLRHAESREMTHVGLTVLLTNLINWTIGTVDRVVAARMLSSTAVGLYATCYNLVNTPTAVMIGTFQPVMYAACARVQGDNEKVRSAYFALLGAITFGVMPVFAAVAVVPETLVLALYGEAWVGAVAVLSPLALGMPLYMIWSISTPVLWTRGRISREFTIQLPLALAWVVASVVAATHSLGALAWTVFGLFTLRALVGSIVAMRSLGTQLREALRVIGPGVLVSLAAAGTGVLGDRILFAAIENPVPRLLAIAVGCAVIYIGGLRVLSRAMHPELVRLIGQTVAGVSPRAALFIERFVFGLDKR